MGAWAGDRLGEGFLGRDANLTAGQARIPQAYGLDSLEQLLASDSETGSGLRGACSHATYITEKRRE